MPEIIKHPVYPEKNVQTCEKCSCEFKYFDSEVEHDGGEVFDAYCCWSSIKCPGCGKIITLSTDVFEEPNWIDSLSNLLAKIRKKFSKKRGCKANEK